MRTATVVLLVSILLAPAVARAGDHGFTARAVLDGRELVKERSLTSKLPLVVTVIAPDGEESPAVCIYGPIRPLGAVPRPGAAGPPLP